MDREATSLRPLIVAEHASAQFGGEAALALHWFRVLRQRGMEVRLLTHARRREELERLFPGEPRILYIEDSALHRLMHRLGRHLPARIAFFTLGFVSRLSTQVQQRAVVKRLVAEEGVDVVHQPMPVSPREPSLLYGFGVPVLIGPMNGGMDYPPGFRRTRGAAERLLFGIGTLASGLLNRLMPGKRQAALLLVANERTRRALPAGVSPRVELLVENGVDLSLWRPAPAAAATGPATFVYMGRLVDWKAVDLLLRAFKAAAARAPMRLLVIGDGIERPRLEALAEALGVGEGAGAAGEGAVGENAAGEGAAVDLGARAGAARQRGASRVRFAGWLSQRDCAESLQAGDCLVLPSILECGGAVVLEAMAMGKPVIATAWGGPLDYLDASCGVLVPPDSPEALVHGFAEAMVRLATDAAGRERMGRAGRAKVLRDYDWEVKADRMLELYLAACASAPSAARAAAGPAARQLP